MSAANLPPLPEPHGHLPESVVGYFTDEQMHDFGQASRKAALEDALDACCGNQYTADAVVEIKELLK